MLDERWTYSSSRKLTQWYGNVGYYGQYVIGQWFVLDANTGSEYWSRTFFRPNTICGCSADTIVASETRSDGPWTADFGIYGIDAKTGALLWTNHARGAWGTLLRALDRVPGFTNDFRDSPARIVGECVATSRGRNLDIRTGQERQQSQENIVIQKEADSQAQILYKSGFQNGKPLELDGDTLKIQGARDQFSVIRTDKNGHVSWRFDAQEQSLHVDGNYYSHRYHDGRIYIILGDAPHYVPTPNKPRYVQENPANYQLGILDVKTGKCDQYPLNLGKHRKECRIEDVGNSRILISFDRTFLAEYSV